MDWESEIVSHSSAAGDESLALMIRSFQRTGRWHGHVLRAVLLELDLKALNHRRATGPSSAGKMVVSDSVGFQVATRPYH